MVESIYFLKPAWCGTPCAGLWPEQGLQPVRKAFAFRGDGLSLGFGLTSGSKAGSRNAPGSVAAFHLVLEGLEESSFFRRKPGRVCFTRALPGTINNRVQDLLRHQAQSLEFLPVHP